MDAAKMFGKPMALKPNGRSFSMEDWSDSMDAYNMFGKPMVLKTFSRSRPLMHVFALCGWGEGFSAWYGSLLAPSPVEPDDALVVEHIDGRPSSNCPLVGNRPLCATGTIPERAPSDAHLLGLFAVEVLVLITIDTNQGKRLILQTFHERPLVRDHFHARGSPESPEVEHHNFAPIVF